MEFPPIPPAFETFGLPIQASPPHLQLMTGPEMSRYWFISNDETELIQIQKDRLIYNWRRQTLDTIYPHYEPIKEKFAREIYNVEKFFSEKNLGRIAPNQCEVTYINHMAAKDEGQGKLGRIFTVWSESYSDSYIQMTEQGQFNISFIIRGDRDDAVGRLHVSAQMAYNQVTSQEIIQFSLVARGRPEAQTIESALAWLDVGRNAIVRGFTSLTRPEVHKTWGRKDV
jgi:uncharacterized protein (TIGR04255 family)